MSVLYADISLVKFELALSAFFLFSANCATTASPLFDFGFEKVDVDGELEEMVSSGACSNADDASWAWSESILLLPFFADAAPNTVFSSPKGGRDMMWLRVRKIHAR